MDRLGVLLERLHGFFGAVEAAAARGGARLTELELGSRARSSLVAADLAALRPGRHRLSGALAPLALPDADATLGALYVTEGSTLGGQVIARRLRTRLGLTAGQTTSFDPYGPDTAQRWQELRAFLDAWPGPPAGVVAGARAAFACYATWVLAPVALAEQERIA
ncbi:MAG: biliverdin-producing heme oxygenase [Acidimicrobiales bacterium]